MAPKPDPEDEEPAAEEVEAEAEQVEDQEPGGAEGEGVPLAAPPPGAEGASCPPADALPGFGEASQSLLSKYIDEKAWHDNWATEGQPTGMAHDDRWALIGQAVGAGGIQGLTGAASALLVDTLLNKATRNIPYASGFIAMGEIFVKGPGVWAEEQGAATFGNIMKGGEKLFGGESDWIDRIEGVVDILSGLNNFVGLASTICMIFAAGGFLFSFVFPALLPFVALAAKWGLLLGEINTLVGLGITALRAITMVARAAQIAASDADPALQAARAEKLREATAAWTQEYATRQGNKHLRVRAEEAAARREAGGRTPASTTPSSGGDGATATVAQQSSRRRSVLDRTVSLLGGGDAGKTASNVHDQHQEIGRIRDAITQNQGNARLEAVQLASPDALSDESAARLRRYNDKQEARAADVAAEGRMQAAQQRVEDALADNRQASERARATRTEHEDAQARLERARQEALAADADAPERVVSRRQALAEAERNVEALTSDRRAKEDLARSREAYRDALEEKVEAVRQTDPDVAARLNQPLHEARIAALHARHDADNADIELRHAQLLRKVEADLLVSEERVWHVLEGRVHPQDAEERALAAAGRRDEAAQGAEATNRRLLDEGEELKRADGEARAAADLRAQTEQEDSAFARIANAGSATLSAAKDTGARFFSLDNMAGNQVPAAGYGHQGTGGATGAGTGHVLNALGGVTTAVNDGLTGWAAATADTDVDDPQRAAAAQAAREAFVESSRAGMDEDFRSMSANLPAPPVEQEQSLQASAERYAAVDEELRLLEGQCATLDEMEHGVEVEREVIEGLHQQVQADSALVQGHQAELDGKRTAQDQTRARIDEQRGQADELSSRQGAQMGPIMGFVNRFVELMGMVPRRVVGNAGAASTGAQQLGEGMRATGEASGDVSGRSDQADVVLDEMGAQVEQADALNAESATGLGALDGVLAADLAEAELGVTGVDEARTTHARQRALLEAEKANQQAAWQASVDAMLGWSTNHESLRTTGEERIEVNLTDIEARLAEHEATIAGG